jgi:hypothetical protein
MRKLSGRPYPDVSYAVHGVIMDDSLTRHLEDLLRTYQRRLRVLEIQEATYGSRTPPEVIIEIEDVRAKIAQTQTELCASKERSTDQQTAPEIPPLDHHPAFQHLSTTLAANPFGYVGCITDPALFFGRDEVLRQIFEDLAKGCSRSLVGEAQVGKSSILAMVCKLGPKHLALPPEAFIYLDMQVVRDGHDFFEALCDNLGVTTSYGYQLARRLRGKRYVLCLDEVEKMAKDSFTGEEREELRGLSNRTDAPLKLVIASRVPLEQLFPDSFGMTSPLANICPQMNISPFDPDTARSFLTRRLDGTGIMFTNTEIDNLVTESGGNPAKLQRMAADLFDKYRNVRYGNAKISMEI